MRTATSLAALVLLLSTSAADGAERGAAAPTRERSLPRAFPAVQAFADAAVRDGKVPGIAIAIGVGNAAPTWVVAGRTAFAGTTPAGPDTTSVYLAAPSFPYGGAGLVSSARDYDRFLHMLLDDGRLGTRRILSAATARLARSNLMPPGVFMTGQDPVRPASRSGSARAVS